MKTTLFTVALLLVSHLCNAQRIFETTFSSWDNPNLSVETFDNVVVSGYTETNPATGLLTPTFKISSTTGVPLNAYYVDYPDAVYLMDFTIREATNTIILAGMTAVTTGGTPFKMIVAEVDLTTGAPVQSSLEYTYNANSMVPHQVIHSEAMGQVTVVGTEIVGTITSGSYAANPKYGFVLGLDINNFNSILYNPIEMDLPTLSPSDYDMLENITEVDGAGYFISGSCNGPSGEQNLLTMGIDYLGNVTFSRIVDNTNSRYAGSSVMYNSSLNVVYLLANNSIIHQYQIAQCDPTTGIFLTPWFSHQFSTLPIGSGVDQNGFRLQQTLSNQIIVGGYLSAPFGSLPEQLTPFQVVMNSSLGFLAAKYYQSGNNSPLSPSYFEENGNSVFINTPDMIAYNANEKRTYLVNQNTVTGGFDLNVSSLYKTSKCEQSLSVNTFTVTPSLVGVGSFTPLPMYTNSYSPAGITRPIWEHILCESVSPNAIATPTVTLAPNPATDQLSITLNEETILQVDVYDLKGNLILSAPGTDRTANAINLTIGKLNQGTYLMKILTKEGSIRCEKFVKE